MQIDGVVLDLFFLPFRSGSGLVVFKKWYCFNCEILLNTFNVKNTDIFFLKLNCMSAVVVKQHIKKKFEIVFVKSCP